MTNAELRSAREALNLTQIKMALLLGIDDQRNYSRLETAYEGRQPTKQQARAVEIIQIIYEQQPWMIEYILGRVEN